MSAFIVEPADLMGRLALSLRVGVADGDALVERVVSQAIRRAAHILAPSSKPELRASVRRSLLGLGLGEMLADIVEHTLEELLVFGEILELRAANQDPWERSHFVLRPAPPSFIMHADGMAIIIGVAGDEITPLPADVLHRVRWKGVLRCLSPDDGEDVRAWLRDMGLLELSENAWLRIPNADDPSAYLTLWASQLAGQPPSIAIPGLKVLAQHSPRARHAERWTEILEYRSGIYVARRPQKYGSPVWCVVELERGRCVRFLDITSRGDRVRPCDVAWRIQMAIDSVSGEPQKYRVIEGEGTDELAFASPLPSWAERKLTMVGTKIAYAGSLYSYRLPGQARAAAEQFLQELLWLTPEISDGGH